MWPLVVFQQLSLDGYFVDRNGDMTWGKNDNDEGMAIMGSGSIVSQLAREGVIDEYQIVVNPIALGDGRTMFEGIKERLSLKLTNSRIFDEGRV